MNYFPHLTGIIKRNKKILLNYIDQIKKESDLRSKCALAYQAATYATRHNTDVSSSAEIEAPFLELAKLVEAPMSESYEEGTVLHVATEVYNVGGHSRCVERWVQQYLADNGEQTVIHYPIPPHKQECYKEWNKLSFPITEQIHDEELSLPISLTMSLQDTIFVVNVVNSFPL